MKAQFSALNDFNFFRPVLPSVEPGYLQEMIPKEAPQQPETWEEIMQDMERVIMPGVS